MKSLLGKLGVILVAFVLAGCASKAHWTKPGFNPNEYKQDCYLCEREANILASQQAGAMSSAVNPLLIYAITKKKFFNNCMEAKGYQQFKSDKEKELIESLDKKIPDEREQITKPFETAKGAEVWGADWKYFATSSGNNIFYFDQESLTYPSEKAVRVWTKTFYSPESVIDVIVGHGEKFKDLSYTLTLKEIDCKDKRSRHLSENYYSKDGRLLVTYDNLQWLFIRPESIEEALSKKICK